MEDRRWLGLVWGILFLIIFVGLDGSSKVIGHSGFFDQCV